MSPIGEESHFFGGDRGTYSFLAQSESVTFWESLNPSLNITDNPFDRSLSPYSFHESDIRNCVQSVREEGYFQSNPAIPKEDYEPLASAVIRVVTEGFHPTFVMVYDEFWQVYSRLSALLEPILDEGYKLVGDLWVWYLSPDQQTAGWKPHRDYQYRESLRPDGRPSVITVWIPVTDSTPLNGCMNVLPASLDPNLPDHPERQVVDNVQDVRCLPAPAGSILGWNQYVLHWGGRCSKRSVQPRISYAIYMKSKDVNSYAPLVVDLSGPLSFADRLAFIAEGFLRYNHEFQFPGPLIQLARKFWHRRQLSFLSDHELRHIKRS